MFTFERSWTRWVGPRSDLIHAAKHAADVLETWSGYESGYNVTIQHAHGLAERSDALDSIEKLHRDDLPKITTLAIEVAPDNIRWLEKRFAGERFEPEPAPDVPTLSYVHAARRRRGIAHVARPMLGYRIDGAEIVGVDDAEAAAVRLAFSLRTQEYGLSAIGRELEREGFASKTGLPRLSPSTLSSMLRNPVYAGLVRLPDGELIEGQHEAIVPLELFERVQHTWKRTAARAKRGPSLLTGLLVCHACGYTLSHDRAPKGWPIYRCAARNRSRPCPRPVTIRGDYAEEYVEQLFLRRFDPKRMPNGGRIKRTRQQSEWQRKAARLRSRADELTRALDRLSDQRHVKGTLEADEYDRQFRRYAKERADAIEQAADLDEKTASAEPLDLDVLALWPSTPDPVKQRALRLMIDQIVVKPPVRTGRGQRELVPKRLAIAWLR